MITSRELVPFQKKVSVLAEEVKTLEIKGAKDMEKAVIILSNINKYADSVKEKKEKLTKPINEGLKNIRAMFKPLEEVYNEATDILRTKMSVYQTAEVKRVKDEEIKIAERVAPGKGNLSVSTAIKKIEQIDAPEKEVATDAGLVQFRETPTLKITMAALIPREYLVPDEKKILADLKAGKTIPGCVIEIIQTVVNYR